MVYSILTIISTLIIWGYGYAMYSIGKSHGMDRMIINVAKAEGVIEEIKEGKNEKVYSLYAPQKGGGYGRKSVRICTERV